LVQAGIVKNVKYGVKVLGKGSEKIDYPVKLEVSDASKTVIKKLQ
jgi:ribosomal protein L15